MRAILIVALTALGIGLAGTTASPAAPAMGGPIGDAARVNGVVDQAHWRWHRHHRRHHRHHHRHCWWHRGHLHCGWW